MESKKINVIDLFAGCGGLSEGLLQVGDERSFLPEGLLPQSAWNQNIPPQPYNILAHVEWELPMVRTLRCNLEKRWSHDDSKKRVIYFDIQETDALIHGCKLPENQALKNKYIDNHSDFLEGGLDNIIGDQKVDLIVGGPPCQAYSLAGRAQDKNGMRDDYRNFLFESFAKVVDYYKPKLFIFENVEGLLSASPGGKLATKLIDEHFMSIGYKILSPNELNKALFDLSLFGVPQKRKRLIIIGISTKHFTNCEAKLSFFYNEIKKHENKSKFFTFRNATSHLTQANANHNNVLHRPRFHNEIDKKLFFDWIDQKFDQKTTSEKLDFYNKRLGKNSNHIKYRSLDWDKPSPTIVAHLSKDGLMFIHPDKEQSRSITILEAALLQTFPEDYLFPESRCMTYKMIGNAVPPLFARRLGELILNWLR